MNVKVKLTYPPNVGKIRVIETTVADGLSGEALKAAIDTKVRGIARTDEEWTGGWDLVPPS